MSSIPKPKPKCAFGTKQLASGAADNTIHLWNVATGSLLATFVAAEDGWLVFTPNGRYRTAGSLSGIFAYTIGLCRLSRACPG